jgi:hypothetical protein
MAINREHARQWLKAFDFKSLFIEELGWDNLATNLVKQIDGADYRFHAVAEKRGVVVLSPIPFLNTPFESSSTSSLPRITSSI